MTVTIPCTTSKVKNGKFVPCNEVFLTDVNKKIGGVVTATYPNHALSTDHSNAVIVLEISDE